MATDIRFIDLSQWVMDGTGGFQSRDGVIKIFVRAFKDNYKNRYLERYGLHYARDSTQG